MKTTQRTSRGITSPEAPQNSASHNPLSIADIRLYRRPYVLPRIQVSRSSRLASIQVGHYAHEHHISPRKTACRSDDINHLIQRLEAVA
jgi:hypothetical protein